MSDLIDRKKAIDAIKKEWEEPLRSGETWEIIERTCDRIYNLPSAEPKKERWIWDENGMDWNIGAWTCSACGSKAETFWQTYKESNPHRYAGSHYCPNCGAKMEVTE